MTGSRASQRVIFLSRTYPPQGGAVGELVQQLAEFLTARDWQVEVVATRSSAKTDDASASAVRVHRIWALDFGRSSLLGRAIAALLFYPLAFLKILQIARSGSIVVTTTDPPLQLVVGWAAKLFKRLRLIHWSQDIYPETAERLGVLREDGVVARMLRVISSAALRRHDATVSIGRCMTRVLAARGVELQRIAFIPNWGTLEPNQKLDAEAAAIRRENGWDGRFVVMYAGNFGRAHPLELLLEAAALSEANPALHFVFVGEGPGRARLQRRAAQQSRGSISFLPRQPAERLGALLASADVHVALLDPALEGLVVPSKIYNLGIVGRPCFFVGPMRSEATQVIQASGMGEVIESGAGAAPQLAARLQIWQKDPTLILQARAAAVAFARAHPAAASLQAWEALLHSQAGPT